MPPTKVGAQFETRPEFQVNEGVLGLGFEGMPSAVAAFEFLDSNLIAHVGQVTGEKPLAFVVLDCRLWASLSDEALGHLITLRKKLEAVPWKLVLFGLASSLRPTFARFRLDRDYPLVADERELLDLAGILSPELAAWARQTFDKEEFIAGLREVERTGGVELKDFVHELE